MTFDEWMIFAENLAAIGQSSGFLGDLDAAQVRALAHVGVGVFAAARKEIQDRQDDARTALVEAATLQEDDDTARELVSLADLLQACELALTYLEDGAPHTAAERLRAALDTVRGGA